MKKCVGANIVITLALLLMITVATSGPVFAWTLSADFEKGTPGTGARGPSGFGGAGTATLYSTEKKHSGSMSAKMSWLKGSDGWGIDQGSFTYPQHVTNGGEIWARGYYYFASPWSFVSIPVFKVLRTHISNSAGNNAGYHSVLAGGDVNGWPSSTLGYIVASNEPSSYQPNTGTKFDLDQWQCIELYVKLSTTTPVTRIWKNGILIFEDTSHATLSATTDYADFSYIMTYWNGGPPQNQTQYLDDFIITTDKPSMVDSKGNPMIGPDLMEPQPPSGLKISP